MATSPPVEAAGPAEAAAAPRPFIIPLFIPHEGCPHRCIFCNQQSITGSHEQMTPARAAAIIAQQLAWPRRPGRPVQVAFYGGSFTGLARARQQELLAAVRPFRRQGEVTTIRLSTRPDYVERDTASFLLEQGVGIVELGVQSLTDEVLRQSGRGHPAARVAEAFADLQQPGLTVGAQLMLGLPGETTVSQRAGLRRLLVMQPAFLRLYPTLVLRGSGLAALYRQGAYRPLTLSLAVALAAGLKESCDAARIKVVRLGLQPSAELERELIAGPYHPAFGELVLGRMLFRKARALLAATAGRLPRVLCLAAADESIFRGPGNCGLKRLQKLGLLTNTRVEFRPGQRRHTVEIEKPGNRDRG